MGGGIILIPALTFLFSFSQHEAQALNLCVFFPMAICALIMHFKNKLILKKEALFIILGGVPTSVLGAYLAVNVQEKALKFIFGIFLIIVAITRAFKQFKAAKRS